MVEYGKDKAKKRQRDGMEKGSKGRGEEGREEEGKNSRKIDGE